MLHLGTGRKLVGLQFISKISFDMAFDFKKEYKEFYMPNAVPALVDVPAMNYIAVRGNGNPNEPDGEYKKALQILYPVAYTLKMSYKTDYRIDGFFEYVVPPLEGFWWNGEDEGMVFSDKSRLSWISMIRVPDFVSADDIEWARKTLAAKKGLDCSSLEFITVEEGLCAQSMHLGAYDDEPETLAVLDRYISSSGYVKDFSTTRRHHEIYLSDPTRCAPQKLKTVLRIPVRKSEIR